MATQTSTIETLQTDNRALRLELARAQAELHYIRTDINGGHYSILHRGKFPNCPSPDCVRVRVLLGREENGNG